MKREIHRFWTGFAAGSFLACAILIANTIQVPDRPALALAATFGIGMVGWALTGGGR